MKSKKITRIDLLANNPPRVFFERNVNPNALAMYHPTHTSWQRLARTVNAWLMSDMCKLRANYSQPGLVIDCIKKELNQ